MGRAISKRLKIQIITLSDIRCLQQLFCCFIRTCHERCNGTAWVFDKTTMSVLLPSLTTYYVF